MTSTTDDSSRHSPAALPLSYYFLAGGIGDCTAALVSHPFDTIKVRQQINVQHQQSLRETLSTILTKEGVPGVYRGLSASIARQSIFSTLRHGGYASLCSVLVGTEMLTTTATTTATTTTTTNNNLPPHPSQGLHLTQCIATGAFIGSVAAFVANPTDVALIRMQSDGHWPPAQQRNYHHVGHAIRTILRTESAATLWRGCGPTVVRASLVTTTQLPTYHVTKQLLLQNLPTHYFPKSHNDSKLHVLASINSAAVASIVTCPVDVVKTRIINMQRTTGTTGTTGATQRRASPYYTSAWDCVLKTVRAEGLLSLFKGIVPTFLRLGPHTIVLWNVQEWVLRSMHASK